MKKRVAALLLSCALLVGALSGCAQKDTGTGAVPAGGEPEQTSSQAPVVKEPSTVRLMSAGDNLIHSSIYKQAKARGTNGSYDFSYAYKKHRGHHCSGGSAGY